MSKFQYYREKMECGRRPKGESFDDSLAFTNEEEELEEEEEEDDVDEEVNFDDSNRPLGGQIWKDYAEDLDYDQ